jgi:hypothetical protein
VFVPGHETIQCREHGQGVGAVGFDAFVFVIPVAWADDVMGHAQEGELTVQAVTKRSGFVAGNNLPALADLFLHPRQKILRGETLGWLGAAAVVLHGDDVLEQRHVQREFENARGLRLKLRTEVSYRLRCGNRRCRNNFVIVHMGRHCGTHVRPVSALMFSLRRHARAAAINSETKIAAGHHAACGFFVATSGQPPKTL